jgi:hypothetical protein
MRILLLATCFASSLVRRASLLVMAMIVGMPQAIACSADFIVAAPGVYFAPADGRPFQIFATLPAGMRGVLELGRRQFGDHWEITDRPDYDGLMWRVEPDVVERNDTKPVRLLLLGRSEGADIIPVRFDPIAGKPSAGQILVTITMKPEPVPRDVSIPATKC